MRKFSDNLTPESFWKIYSTEFKNFWFNNEKENIRSYPNYKSWTENMMNFLEKLAYHDFIISKEYWPRIDCGYFSKAGDNWSEWSFEVAIEHENKVWPAWQNECCKLMIINAGLKVLITYQSEGKIELPNHFSKFFTIYKSRKYHEINDQWLFIIAPNMNRWGKEDIIAYKFDGKTLPFEIGSLNIFSPENRE
jgi:hypothetical protein